MAYSKYRNVKKVVDKFGIKAVPASLFAATVLRVEPTDWLVQTLRKMSSLGYDTEKERSERLIAPILAEIRELNDNELTIYSGHNLDVDAANDLNGECDYLLALGRKIPDYVDTPIFSIVEAKKQDFDLGTGQCAAQMVGATKYNETDGKPIPFMYGAATDGVKWRFMKLEKNILSIDDRYYVTQDLSELLGVLQFVFEECKKNEILLTA